ncbi:hypothetical protein BcDW1_9452 [Botrytis cinerea BcDW1]|uniref:Uncharacterized protein n=1 Tax=Botryotinia fuckeliana (strain BcDW1) TaxID=1290391 RepID=M7UEL7_BOTF1|nr:hypothetical protein BcDW1_9452 [Botrytis cinerea BcDW1]
MSSPSVKVGRGRRPESNRKPEKTGKSRSRSSNPESGRSPSNNRVAGSRERRNKNSSSSKTDGSTKDDQVKDLEDEVQEYIDNEKECNGYIKSSEKLSRAEIMVNGVFKSKASFYRRHKLTTQKKLLKLLKDLKEPTDELEMAIRTHENQYGDEE